MLRQSSSTQEPPTEITHGNYCDQCGQFPIHGSRYKCLHCNDYDICSNCVSTSTSHPVGHMFVRLPQKTPLLEGRIVPLPVPNIAQQQQEQQCSFVTLGAVHQNTICDVCSVCPIRGVRVKALLETDWDCCKNCLQGSIHSENPVVLIKDALVNGQITFPQWLHTAALSRNNEQVMMTSNNSDRKTTTTTELFKYGQAPTEYDTMMLRLRTQLRFYCEDGSEYNFVQMKFNKTDNESEFESSFQLLNCHCIQLNQQASNNNDNESNWSYEIWSKANNTVIKVGEISTLQTKLHLNVLPNVPTTYGLRLIKKPVLITPEYISDTNIKLNKYYNVAYGKNLYYSHLPQRNVHGLHEWTPPIIGNSVENSTGKTINGTMPWIDVYIGGGIGPVFCSEIKIQLLPIPKSNTPKRIIRIRLRSYATTEHDIASWSATGIEDDQGYLEFIGLKQSARMLRIEIVNYSSNNSTTTQQNIPLQIRNLICLGAPVWGNTLLSTYSRAFSFHKNKRLFGTRKKTEKNTTSSTSTSDFRWLTYSQVWERIIQFSNGLKARIQLMDIDPSHGVAIMARNCEEWLIARIACLMIGRLFIGVAYNLNVDQIIPVLKQGRAAILITDSSSIDTVTKCSMINNNSGIHLIIHIEPENTQVTKSSTSTTSSSTSYSISWCPMESFLSVETSMPNSISCSSMTRTTTKPTSIFIKPKLLRTHSGRMTSDAEDRPSLMLFTSGSGGIPKGVVRSNKEQHLLLKGYGVPQIARHLSIQPLSHLSESCTIPGIFWQGGHIGFPTYYNDGLDLFEDLRIIQPTFLYSVPRFFETVQSLFNSCVQSFNSDNNNNGYDKAVEYFRSSNGPLGNSLSSLSVGSAPVTESLYNFMKDVFDIDNGGTASVSRGYGSTECGTVSMNGRVYWTARVLLVEMIEEGLSFNCDRPRGEILIHTDKVISNYATGKTSGIVVDGYPYFRPGDACETNRESFNDCEWQGTLDSRWGEDLNGRRAVLLKTNHILEVVGRTKNVVKLSNGEFVSPEIIERKLDGIAPSIVDQLLVVIDKKRSGVVVLVVPYNLELEGDVEEEEKLLKLYRQRISLQYEKPLNVAIVGHKWTADRGTMTSSNKLDRKGIIKECYKTHLYRIGCILDNMVELTESIAFEHNTTTATTNKNKNKNKNQNQRQQKQQSTELVDRVCDFYCESNHIIAKSYLPELKHGTDMLDTIGLDSLSAALISELISSKLSIRINVKQLMQKSLYQIWSIIHEQNMTTTTTSTTRATTSNMKNELKSTEYWVNEANFSNFLKSSSSSSSSSSSKSTSLVNNETTSTAYTATIKSNSYLLITGVTGFIGPHLLEYVVQHSQWTNVIAIVRPPLDRVQIPSFGLYNVHVELIPGDISRPDLGLSSSSWKYLSSISFDCVIHSAALVNHIRTYEQIKPHNVTACDDLVRLVSSSSNPPPSFLFVSTVSAVGPGADENFISTPANFVNCLGSGYGQSKWVAERRLRNATNNNLLRHLTIVRLGLIGPHSIYGHMANYKDWLHLFIQSCQSMRVRPQMNNLTSNIELLPVDVTAKIMASLAVTGASTSINSSNSSSSNSSSSNSSSSSSGSSNSSSSNSSSSNSSSSNSSKIRVVQLDARAAGMKAFNVLSLLDKLAQVDEQVSKKKWFTPLPFPQWCDKAQKYGGKPLVALSVIPGSRSQNDTIYSLPDPLNDTLIRGNIVKDTMIKNNINNTNMLQCYDSEEFQISWSKGCLKNE